MKKCTHSPPGRLVLIVCFLTVYFAAACFTTAGPAAAQECECPPKDEAISRAIVEQAELIAAGEVLSHVPNGKFSLFDPEIDPPSENPDLSLVTIMIEDYYKGDVEGDTVLVYMDTLSSCGYDVEAGQIFYIFAGRYKGELIQANVCNLPDRKYWPEKARTVKREESTRSERYKEHGL